MFRQSESGFHSRPYSNSRAAPALAALILAGALLVASACGGSSPTATVEQGGQVRGLVLEVLGRRAADLETLETLQIRDESGKQWTFALGKEFIGFNASHLRQHQALGAAVLVTYTTRDGVLMAEHIGD